MCNFGGSKAVLLRKKGIIIPIPMNQEEIDPDDAIIAWRSWNVRAGFLAATYMETKWMPGAPLEADHLTPTGDSGLYAFEDERNALDQHGDVWGQVALWGGIYHHPSRGGYRAEYGYPLSLYSSSLTTAQHLGRTYGPSGVYVNHAQRQDARKPGKLTFINL